MSDPWRLLNSKFGPWIVIDSTGNCVATVGDGCSEPAKAKLVAAVPEMVDMLRELEWAAGASFGPSGDDQELKDCACFFCDGRRNEFSRLGVGGHVHKYEAGHEPGCKWVALMRKAGVLSPGEDE